MGVLAAHADDATSAVSIDRQLFSVLGASPTCQVISLKSGEFDAQFGAFVPRVRDREPEVVAVDAIRVGHGPA